MRRFKEIHSSKLVLILILGLLLSYHVNAQQRTDSYPFPKNAVKVGFKELKRDSLKKILTISVFNDNAKDTIGRISSINFGPDYIYLADRKQSKIFLLDRKTFSRVATIGNVGNAQSNLDRPFGLQVFKDKLMMANEVGPSLFSFYSLNGDFISSTPRESFDYNSSMDYSLFVQDSMVYTTMGFARNHKKVEILNINNSAKIKEILPISDFHSMEDSLRFSNILTALFLSRSTKDSSIFYAMPIDKPLVNVYKMDGRLLKSYDLTSIPIFEKHYSEHKELFRRLVLPKNTSPNYFSNVIGDNRDNLIFPCQRIFDVERAVHAINNFKSDSSNLENYFVFVNMIDKTYKVFKCQELFDTKPMKVIDDNLWCFNPVTSSIVVYKLPVK